MGRPTASAITSNNNAVANFARFLADRSDDRDRWTLSSTVIAHVLGGSPEDSGEPLRAIRKWRDISSISTLGLNALINPSLGHRPLTVICQHRRKEKRHYSYLLRAFKDRFTFGKYITWSESAIKTKVNKTEYVIKDFMVVLELTRIQFSGTLLAKRRCRSLLIRGYTAVNVFLDD
ncbi:hypothetical protein TcasGA2_TC010731 [Tribolium castaneum]|uniref:Uncharacterized protein n=1 Tax=Tribolium castaneum TaxID=7070 RepID=D7GXW0_TRICA|nr:hypothetical protein TcasGA2_TC010731 [Tribolium castaneum]